MNSRAELIAASLDARTMELWPQLQERLGGTGYRVADGEFCRALVVDEELATGEPYVAKIPISNNCDGRHALAQEAEVMVAMADAPTPPPVEVSQLIDMGHHDSEACIIKIVPWMGDSEVRHVKEADFIVGSYVAGETLSFDRWHQELTDDEQLELGAVLGKFISWFGSVVDVDTYRRITDGENQVFYEQYKISKMLLMVSRSRHLVGNSEFQAVVRDFANMMVPRKKPMIIHNDLRPDNLRLVGGRGARMLSGIIDYNFAGPGDLALELRHVYMIGNQIARQAITTYYEQEGGSYEPMEILDQSCYWAIVQAAINYFYRRRLGVSLGSMRYKLDAFGETWIDDEPAA